MTVRLLFLCGLLLVGMALNTPAQQPPANTADLTSSNPIEPPTPSPPASEGRKWTSIEIALSISILIFGAAVIAVQTFLFVKLPLDWTPSAILQFNGLTLIITGALLLVTAGYSDQQISPVLGLLGAIAGYLLGAADRRVSSPPPSVTPVAASHASPRP